MKEFEPMHRAIMDFRKIADGIDSAKDPKTYELYQVILDYAASYAETVVKDKLELMVDSCTKLRQECVRCKYFHDCDELLWTAIDTCGSACPRRWSAKDVQNLTNELYVQLADGGEEYDTKEE